MARVILDSGVLVAAVRDRHHIDDEDDIAIPAVAEAEYLAGVLADGDPVRRERQQKFLDEVLAVVPVVDYTSAIAREHAELLAYVRSVGQPRGAHDLIIAATARYTGRTLITTDHRARFDDLPGLADAVRIVEP